MASSIVLRPVQVPWELCLARVSSELASKTVNASMDAINKFSDSNMQHRRRPVTFSGQALQGTRWACGWAAGCDAYAGAADLVRGACGGAPAAAASTPGPREERQRREERPTKKNTGERRMGWIDGIQNRLAHRQNRYFRGSVKGKQKRNSRNRKMEAKFLILEEFIF